MTTTTPTTRLFPLILATLTLAAQLAAAAPLGTSIEQHIRNTNLGRADVAIHVVDLDTGAEIASHNGDDPLIPASNMKILSSGAALLALGEDFAFRTSIEILERDGRTSVVIRGSGDPALGDPELYDDNDPARLTHDALFDAIAGALKDRGVTSVHEIVVDDRIFDREYAHPCWPDDQLNRWYCAEVAGLNFHTNVISVFPSPGSPGSAPNVTTDPDLPHLRVRVKAKTVSKGRDSAWVARPRPENNFTLYGNVRGKTEIPVAVHEPARFAGEVFAKELNERGVTLSAPIQQAVRLAGALDRFEETTPAAVVSTPIIEVLRRTNTDSHNLYAEALLKRLGHEITGDPGSWQNGTSVLRLMLSEQISAGAVQNASFHDGSGMCRSNKVAPSLITRWLTVLADHPSWDTFRDSLATPGEGTLRNRFRKPGLDSTIHAKSGYLNSVYALSGVLEHPSGRRVAFSIMINNIEPGPVSRRAKPFIDDVVEEIDAWIANRSPAFGG